MVEKAATDTIKEEVLSMAGKAAGYLEKLLSPIATWFSYVGATVLGGLVLMLLVSIISRRIFNSPLKGSFELTELSLVVITFSLLAFDNLRHESMIIDVLVKHFPARSRDILRVIIHFFTTAMLGVLGWQLVVQAIRVQGFHQTTRILEIPIYPLLYLAAFGILLLTVVYLKHFLVSLDKVIKP
jgi:TRAP-type C4-dicarboxylate transport system permease small subunit